MNHRLYQTKTESSNTSIQITRLSSASSKLESDMTFCNPYKHEECDVYPHCGCDNHTIPSEEDPKPEEPTCYPLCRH